MLNFHNMFWELIQKLLWSSYDTFQDFIKLTPLLLSLFKIFIKLIYKLAITNFTEHLEIFFLQAFSTNTCLHLQYVNTIWEVNLTGLFQMVCIWGGKSRYYVFFARKRNIKHRVSIQSHVLIIMFYVGLTDSSMSLGRASLFGYFQKFWKTSNPRF